MAQQKTRIYSVSQVNHLIKAALDQSLPAQMVVKGEITDFKLHHSGHAYFALKDEKSVLPVVLWKSTLAKVKFVPENGMAVLATGYIDVYPPQGRYQFHVEKLVPEGQGALQIAFEQMVKRLQAEGLFADEHKKPLPKYPMRIGIVTSQSGAALGDIQTSIHNRWPCAKLFLYPVPVQGEGAAEKIAAAITDINQRNAGLKLDILIVGRGGGSMEDLWAFNEEPLARAVFASDLPVISAVGHEVDTTICDLVADARASTPTKAGVIAVPDMQEVLAQLTVIGRRLDSEIRGRVRLADQQLKTILAGAIFKRPQTMVLNRQQQLDETALRLSAASKGLFTQLKQRLDDFAVQLASIEPHRLLGQKRLDLSTLANRMTTGVYRVKEQRQLQLASLTGKLAAMDPRAVLKRGYSLTTNLATGRLVKTVADVKIGDTIRTELADRKTIESQVKKV